jgi:hypothetical protein
MLQLVYDDMMYIINFLPAYFSYFVRFALSSKYYWIFARRQRSGAMLVDIAPNFSELFYLSCFIPGIHRPPSIGSKLNRPGQAISGL